MDLRARAMMHTEHALSMAKSPHFFPDPELPSLPFSGCRRRLDKGQLSSTQVQFLLAVCRGYSAISYRLPFAVPHSIFIIPLGPD